MLMDTLIPLGGMIAFATLATFVIIPFAEYLKLRMLKRQLDRMKRMHKC
jgi:hypothetical protein